MACTKKTYQTENLALEALIEARTRFVQNTSNNVYRCEECGNWHLTSKGEVSPKLQKMMQNGSLERSRLAYYWERKLGK
jgi:hypothetical protein